MKSFTPNVLVIVLAGIMLLTGCASQQSVSTTPSNGTVDTDTTVALQADENGKALNIVTTFPPLYAHVSNLIDGNDSVTNLVPAGTSVHFWQPRPSDVVAMESADMIITNGVGLEEFLEDYLDTLEDSGVQIIDTSIGVETLSFEDKEEDEHHDEHEDEEHHDEHEDDEHYDEHEGDEHHHDHEGPDPHIWLDTNNAIIQVGNITQALISADPSQEAGYTKVRSLYESKIEVLDEEIKNERTNKEVAPFIVFHDAYHYFLRAYDLTDSQVGLIQEFHGDNPSQREIAELIEIIEAQGVQTLFTEPQFNPSVVKRLEEETGIIAKEVDPIGSDVSKDGYIIMMQQLSQAFIQ